jgi:UDP-N-acetylglucosamine transferase subunit ALG13
MMNEPVASGLPHESGPLRVCLAGSGGGHVRQLLDLEPLWRHMNYFMVTENTALGATLKTEHDVEFVEHVALGQAKLGNPIAMLVAAGKNLFQSANIVLRRRPDVVISTGAGATFFTVFWARLLGARVIVIDSMARITGPSTFARVAGTIADVRISQSEIASRNWPGSILFDSLRVSPCPDDVQKEDLLFATVGATLSFDRLILMVQEAKRKGLVPEQVIAQTGLNGHQSDQFPTVESLGFNEVKDILRRASIVVCHGGTGSLITALQQACHVIAIPRLFERGEHYDNHQLEITTAFEARGLIATADSQEEFETALMTMRSRKRVTATRDTSEMVAYISEKLAQWSRAPKFAKRSRNARTRAGSGPSSIQSVAGD